MSPVAYVGDFCFALGSHKRSVEDSAGAGMTRTGADDLRDAGFRYHHVCDADETAYDLARAAVATLDDEVVAGIAAIVYATCIPLNANVGDVTRFCDTGDVKHLMDFPASRLQADLGLDKAIVIGLNQQACTSMLGSVRLADALLGAEPGVQRILCLTSDRFPPGAFYEQAYSLISDGAAGCIVSRTPADYRLVAAHHITNGAMVAADDDETVGAYFSYTHRLLGELLAPRWRGERLLPVQRRGMVGSGRLRGAAPGGGPRRRPRRCGRVPQLHPPGPCHPTRAERDAGTNCSGGSGGADGSQPGALPDGGEPGAQLAEPLTRLSPPFPPRRRG
ncbi:MAG: hypothetical protein M3011_03105 [Actinomycetota bacterium]|nr:hypothetical protein [Actinomycetota bacterium]